MTQAECSECGEKYGLEDWVASGNRCPGCGTRHVVPHLHAALHAARQGELRGQGFDEVLEDYGLDPVNAANLLLTLGVSAEAALGVERRLQGWPGSEWRRLVGVTRREERRNMEEVRDTLGEFGVDIDVWGE